MEKNEKSVVFLQGRELAPMVRKQKTMEVFPCLLLEQHHVEQEDHDDFGVEKGSRPPDRSSANAFWQHSIYQDEKFGDTIGIQKRNTVFVWFRIPDVSFVFPLFLLVEANLWVHGYRTYAIQSQNYL